jgi:hypothetical protein
MKCLLILPLATCDRVSQSESEVVTSIKWGGSSAPGGKNHTYVAGQSI